MQTVTAESRAEKRRRRRRATAGESGLRFIQSNLLHSYQGGRGGGGRGEGEERRLEYLGSDRRSFAYALGTNVQVVQEVL
jgi:hypothetical protein